MSLHRLFVALRPAPEVRAHLLGLMAGVPGARWQADEQLHCTLRFIGGVTGHQAADIMAALGTVRHDPIEARLDGIGVFDHRGRIETLWVGLAPRAALQHLHAKVDRALTLAGVMPDPRSYRPHITIARFSRRTSPPAGAEGGIRPPSPIIAHFEAMHLYESMLGAEGGAVYRIAASFALRS